MKTYTQPPPILPTNTKIELEKEIFPGDKFKFPNKPKGMNKGYYHEDERDTLDHLLTNTKMIDSKPNNPTNLVESLNTKPEADNEYNNPTTSGLEYLNYFNVKDENKAVAIPQSTLMADLNDYEPVY